MKDRYRYCTEIGGKNCVFIDKCDSFSCRGGCSFHRTWADEVAEASRPKTPEQRIPRDEPPRPTPLRSRSVQVELVSRLVFNRDTVEQSPCPEVGMEEQHEERSTEDMEDIMMQATETTREEAAVAPEN